MSLSSWLRNGTGDEERRLLALQDAEDVDHLYAQWREDRLDDYAPVVPITAAKRRRTVEQASRLSGAGRRPSGAPGHSSAPSTPAEPSHHFKNAAPPVAPGDAA